MLALAIVKFVIVVVACIMVAGLGIRTYLMWKRMICLLDETIQECNKVTAKAEELLEFLKKQ
jgi:hypothetical protein